MLIRVALPIPYSDPFDYSVPEEQRTRVQKGVRVLVPFGNRDMVGVVVETDISSDIESIRAILRLIDNEPVYDERMLSFTRWIADYYLCSWGDVLETALPSGLKPKISRVLKINREVEGFSTLDEQTKTLLEKVERKKKHSASVKSVLKENEALFRKLKKTGLVTEESVLNGDIHLSNMEEWISLGDLSSQYKPRRNSKAFSIIEKLASESEMKLDDLKAAFGRLSPVLDNLLEKAILKKTFKPIENKIFHRSIADERFLKLNEEQKAAEEAILPFIRNAEYGCFLLHGVTGSGKTEVYLHVVRETVKRNRSVLVLIPEISLTPQAVSRFTERFGNRIAVLHSGLSSKERRDEWLRIRNGECDVVIGARSAIFAPLKNIGLIVVDEEHDTSYKQQETPYYSARDTAVKMASDSKAVIILGSATPSVESYFNTTIGKYSLLKLSSRANLKPLPDTEIVNLKIEQRQPGAFYLSKYLISQLKKNFENGKQTLIFLNRRGYASFLSCRECEMPVLCQNCSIAMTWHKSTRSLVCHHCGYSEPYPASCQYCGPSKFTLEGIGTQRIEFDLSVLFRDASFLRMDRDTVQRKGALERSINKINNQEVDFIIGTQLISKGHDFKNIGMVCIVLADMSLNLPDFRSSERSFQLISQVSGRAGRDTEGVGKTLVQTYNPDHFAVRTALTNDYAGFFKDEIELRKTLLNPPFNRMILLRISDRNADYAQESAEHLSRYLISEFSDRNRVLGPVEAPVQKVANRYYWQILMKGETVSSMKRYLKKMFWFGSEFKLRGSTRITIDIDPLVFF